MNSFSFSLRFLHNEKETHSQIKKKPACRFTVRHNVLPECTHMYVIESYYWELPCRYKTFTGLILMKASWKTSGHCVLQPVSVHVKRFSYSVISNEMCTRACTQALTLKTVFITWDFAVILALLDKEVAFCVWEQGSVVMFSSSQL